MAQSIANLTLGSKVKDSKGNIFTVIANNHYSSNQVTLLHTSLSKTLYMGDATQLTLDYAFSNAVSYLNGSTYLGILDSDLLNSICSVNIPYLHKESEKVGYITKTILSKAFLLSPKEIGINSAGNASSEKTMEYVSNNKVSLFPNKAWTREKTIWKSTTYFVCIDNGYASDQNAVSSLNIYPAFNVSESLLVSDSASEGTYNFVFDAPPTISTISNVSVNFGIPAKITYVATDDISENLTHYITFDNGSSWTQISPVKNNNNYTYSYDAGAVGTYFGRIKVVDNSDNATISNLFTITVNSVAPTVNVLSVTDKVITFKVNCLTHEVSKVEILINNNLVKTYSNGFNSSLSYEVDRSVLSLGKNAMRIKATSADNLEGCRDIEINKELYNLPPTGAKVVIGEDTYIIGIARQEGSNQIYTLESNLLSDVDKGQEIKINQDSVRVLCSLSNLESYQDFKEMKLVKIKKLKGQFEGYVEEKYELEGEGRYSSIKLEAERFNNNVESEIIELQQYFDYMED